MNKHFDVENLYRGRCITVDDLLQLLSKVKRKHGGDTKVILNNYDYDDLQKIRHAYTQYIVEWSDGQLEMYDDDNEEMEGMEEVALCLCDYE